MAQAKRAHNQHTWHLPTAPDIRRDGRRALPNSSLQRHQSRHEMEDIAGAKRLQDRHLCTRLQYTALAKRAHNQHTWI